MAQVMLAVYIYWMKKNSRHKRAWRAALGSSTWAWRTSWGISSRTGGSCSVAVARAGSAGCFTVPGQIQERAGKVTSQATTYKTADCSV